MCVCVCMYVYVCMYIYVYVNICVVDDMLDFTGSAESLGKPALSDMEQRICI